MHPRAMQHWDVVVAIALLLSFFAGRMVMRRRRPRSERILDAYKEIREISQYSCDEEEAYARACELVDTDDRRAGVARPAPVLKLQRRDPTEPRSL